VKLQKFRISLFCLRKSFWRCIGRFWWRCVECRLHSSAWFTEQNRGTRKGRNRCRSTASWPAGRSVGRRSW